MSSIIEGYNYDIFISYRQKDNKGDRWVSEFVDALKDELESTFKEEISVYFDINPHDGLLETYIVDKSLESKLKCLIFIPVISQTYCDSKSFAWQHELCAFNKMAKEDKIGRDISLAGGNVASRILPVKIHDLDPDDNTLLENELGGVLRAIEFIHRASGVNRPLTPSDDPDKNLNKTFYRDQINKVANAVKEIITALKKLSRHPEEVSKQGLEVNPTLQKNLRTKIIAGSIIALVLIVFGYFFIPRLFKSKEQLEKSIAVLPFINDSPDQERMYFINGIMESILNNLSMIEDLRVPGRTSLEQYRNNPKPIPVVAEEMNVDYVLEGSGHRDGNNVRLIVQLLDGRKDQHLWSKTYDADIEEIFSMQSEIAQLIAAEIEAIITPEEKQLIEKVPTTSLTALDFYQRGREEHYHYWSDNDSKEELERAEDFYYTALEYDSSFALAYIGLANVYQDKHYWETYLSEDFLDSVLILSDIALSYDNQLSDAYNKKGYYYSQKGRNDQAIAEYEKAIRFNPNDWSAYAMSANLYNMSDDLVKTISYRHKAISLNHGPELSSLLRDLSSIYNNAGFIEKSKFYNQEALKLDNDSASYYFSLMSSERVLGNFEKAVELGEKAYDLDSLSRGTLLRLGEVYLYLGQFEESLKYYKKYIDILKSLGIPYRGASGHIAYDYWACGYKDEVEYYFNEQINYCGRIIELEREFVNKFWEYFTLAQVYAFKGEKDKAFENLNIFNQRQKMCIWEGIVIKNDPLFENIRDEPKFQQIVRDVESKYQAEHERVKKWMEEQEKLGK